MPDPEISVIVPLYNRASSVARTLASIAGRHDGPFEIIVVDDGSQDGSAEAAEAALAGLPGRVIRQANAGPGAARNTGARAAKGRWLAFLDSDDIWFDWTLSLLAQALRQEGESAALVFPELLPMRPATPMPTGDGTLRTERYADYPQACLAAGRGARFGSCNLATPREVFAALGGFDETIRCAEDIDLFLKAVGAGECLMLRGVPMVGYTLGHEGLSGNLDALEAGIDHLLAAHGTTQPARAGARADIDRVLGQASANLPLTAFAMGYPGRAYGALARYLGPMIRGRDWRGLTRLPLTPLLHALRPASFPFRWRPRE